MRILFIIGQESFFLMDIKTELEAINRLFCEFKDAHINMDYTERDWAEFLTQKEVGYYFIMPESDHIMEFK